MFEEIAAKVGQQTVATKHEQLMDFVVTSIVCLDIETYGVDGKPGDSPCYDKHGVLGIAICNLHGDARYLVINDRKDYGGIPMDEAMAWLNHVVLPKAQVLLTHHGKFDLGFLFKRGLFPAHFDNGALRWVDTYILNNLRAEGVFVSSRLKELVAHYFKLTPGTEAAKDEFFEKNKTKDYGDLPIELLAPYACDDVRYCLMLLLGLPSLQEADWRNHDLYIRVWRALIRMEYRGAALNHAMVKERVDQVVKKMNAAKSEVEGLLGAAKDQIPVDDEQVILHYLHQKSLHPGPRQSFGEVVYVFDLDAISDNFEVSPLAKAYAMYHRAKSFLGAFSGAYGEMGTRIFLEEKAVGFRCGTHPSISARGGIVEMKQPDITQRVPLSNEIREMFIPRPGHRFVVCAAQNLKEQLLSYYCQDRDLAARMSTEVTIQDVLAERTKLDPAACELTVKMLVEGSGMGLLASRLKRAGVRFSQGDKGHYKFADTIRAALPGWKGFNLAMDERRKHNEPLTDVLGRRMRIPDDKSWRQHAILINSSYGSVLSYYLDIFSRLSHALGAHLVLAHHNEFVFEVERDNPKFYDACLEISQRDLLPIRPIWWLTESDKWQGV